MENLNYKTTTTLTLTVHLEDGGVLAHTSLEFDTIGDTYDQAIREKTKQLYNLIDPDSYPDYNDLTLYLEIMCADDVFYHDYDKEAIMDVVNNDGLLDIHEDVFGYAKQKYIKDELFSKVDNLAISMLSDKGFISVSANALLANDNSAYPLNELIGSYCELNKGQDVTITIVFIYNGETINYSYISSDKHPNFSDNIELAELLTKAIDDNQKNSEEQ